MRASDILPDDEDQAEFAGETVRKGTVAAFLHNAWTWVAPTTSAVAREGAERDMREALPALRALGLFEVMAVRDLALANLLRGADVQAID